MGLPVVRHKPRQPENQKCQNLRLTRPEAAAVQSLSCLSRQAGRVLKAFACQDTDKVVLFRKLKPGTTVVREYQGVRHIVTITEGGFVWRGSTYGSLSVIAHAITGAKWNGPRFFGLRDPNTGRPARKAS